MKASLGFLMFLSSLGFAVQKIAPKAANALVTEGRAILIDVREASELKAEGKAAPAQWLAKSEIDAKSEVFNEALKTMSKDKLLIFYCGSGKRAQVVAEMFEKMGYKTANAGGLSDWIAAGLPVTH